MLADFVTGEAKIIKSWRLIYNTKRQHSALGNLTPSTFAAQLKPARKVA